MTDSIPTGFAPWRPSSAFMQHLDDLSGFYRRAADDVLALRVGQVLSLIHI